MRLTPRKCVDVALRSGLIEAYGDGFRSTNPMSDDLVAFAKNVLQKLDGAQHNAALRSLQALEPHLEHALPRLGTELRVHALLVLGELAVRLGAASRWSRPSKGALSTALVAHR